METTCPHCAQALELDAATLETLDGASHFDCPACSGAVPVPGNTDAFATSEPDAPNPATSSTDAIEITCPHCSQGIELDALTLEALRGSSHFDCPICAGAVAVPEEPQPPSAPLLAAMKAATAAAPPPVQLGAVPALFHTFRGLNRNVLILGAATVLILGGLGIYLATRNGATAHSTKRDVKNEVINNKFFSDLVASGATNTDALDAVTAIQPIGITYVGVSKEKLTWDQAQELARRTASRILTLDPPGTASRRPVLESVAAAYPDLADSTVWAMDNGEPRVITGADINRVTTLERPRLVFLHWFSRPGKKDSAPAAPAARIETPAPQKTERQGLREQLLGSWIGEEQTPEIRKFVRQTFSTNGSFVMSELELGLPGDSTEVSLKKYAAIKTNGTWRVEGQTLVLIVGSQRLATRGGLRETRRTTEQNGKTLPHVITAIDDSKYVQTDTPHLFRRVILPERTQPLDKLPTQNVTLTAIQMPQSLAPQAGAFARFFAGSFSQDGKLLYAGAKWSRTDSHSGVFKSDRYSIDEARKVTVRSGQPESSGVADGDRWVLLRELELEADNPGTSIVYAHVHYLSPDGKMAVGGYQLKTNDPTEPPFTWSPTDEPPFAAAFVVTGGDAVDVIRGDQKLSLPFAKLSAENVALAKRLDELTIRWTDDPRKQFAERTKFAGVEGDSVLLADPNDANGPRLKLPLKNLPPEAVTKAQRLQKERATLRDPERVDFIWRENAGFVNVNDYVHSLPAIQAAQWKGPAIGKVWAASISPDNKTMACTAEPLGGTFSSFILLLHCPTGFDGK